MIALGRIDKFSGVSVHGLTHLKLSTVDILRNAFVRHSNPDGNIPYTILGVFEAGNHPPFRIKARGPVYIAGRYFTYLQKDGSVVYMGSGADENGTVVRYTIPPSPISISDMDSTLDSATGFDWETFLMHADTWRMFLQDDLGYSRSW